MRYATMLFMFPCPDLRCRICFGLCLSFGLLALLMFWPAWLTLQRWGWSPPADAPTITRLVHLAPGGPDRPAPPAIAELDPAQAYTAFLIVAPLANPGSHQAVIREIDGREVVRGLNLQPVDGLIQFVLLVRTELLEADTSYELILRQGEKPGRTLPEFRYTFITRPAGIGRPAGSRSAPQAFYRESSHGTLTWQWASTGGNQHGE